MSKQVLLVMSGLLHPPLLGRQAFEANLSGMEGYTFRRISSLEALPGVFAGDDAGDIAAIVLYYHHKHISDAALEALDQFVSGGGGLLAAHSATASFKDCPHYFEILGGRFVTHGPVETFMIQPETGTPSEQEPFSGIGPFKIRDELYLHEIQPGIQVHFFTHYRGEKVPAVWTYRYGQGRVCYAVPGHTASSMEHPAVREIFRQGLGWVCGKRDGVDG
jgi:type 1 glutamine amidotransferase